jgi:hypothetical protein
MFSNEVGILLPVGWFFGLEAHYSSILISALFWPLVLFRYRCKALFTLMDLYAD